ncbi:hydroxymethylglutaryl-CoA reductase, degradative [Arthrobacter roseus]|uniref:hydroxymethylglutaryl-CoA reductase, degradative n=1 Tax=Arthrobacter roseus TaxID=136274 RepID=UPI003084612C|nr:hydroxymethylglutaryl-CoA reductase [Arthrobacter roseus]
MSSSRIPGFYRLSLQDRVELLAEEFSLTAEERELLLRDPAQVHANEMVENAVGHYELPLGVGLNFQINGRDYVVPMAIEEPSVIASASYMAKLIREAGGFTAESTGRTMIGQIQVLGCADPLQARTRLMDNAEELIAEANGIMPGMQRRGGGATGLEVRDLPAEDDGAAMLVVHLIVDTRDAMGANTINTMVEGIAGSVERISGGRVHLRILSNFTDHCLARARCSIPTDQLATSGMSGEEVRDGIVAAYQFAARDVYRAVTHNKGVMNGVDAVVIATGNDWRAIEAGSHAYASRKGRYTSMTQWSKGQHGELIGVLELPMPVGIVGGSIGIQRMAQVSLRMLGVESAEELAQIIVSVGLAQNLGALRALATEGIQKGHMALHARSVAMTAGASGNDVAEVARQLAEAHDYRVDTAKEILGRLH